MGRDGTSRPLEENSGSADADGVGDSSNSPATRPIGTPQEGLKPLKLWKMLENGKVWEQEGGA